MNWRPPHFRGGTVRRLRAMLDGYGWSERSASPVLLRHYVWRFLASRTYVNIAAISLKRSGALIVPYVVVAFGILTLSVVT